MTRNGPLRVLICDDEPPARARVRAMLSAHSDYELSGETGDGAAAADIIVRDRPDIVFLDIKMPELNGFEVLDALRAAEHDPPAIVFVTAYDAYALSAFDAGAIDYLLKPFDQARFDRALAAASERVAGQRLRARMTAPADEPAADFLRTVGGPRRFPERFLVRRGRQMQFARADSIDWLDAQGNYVQLHIDGRAHLYRGTMAAMEERLDPAHFVRVHRSAIVNIERISSIEPHTHGEFLLTLRDGTRLTTSAGHSDKLRGLLRSAG